MQQPALAPAPHSTQLQEAASSAEQTLRAHLLPHTVSQPAPAANASDKAHHQDMQIDPAISGVGQQQQQQNAPPPPPPAPQQQQTQQVANNNPVPVPQVPQPGPPPQSPGVMMGAGMMTQGDGSASDEHGDGGTGKGRGGKRELSTSKRAAQNRAAQRAFRQRKEGYIKKLEEQVRDFTNMQESYKSIQAENFQLRDYIINLQSRLIESQGEDAVPPPPHSLIHPTPPLQLISQSPPPPPAAQQPPPVPQPLPQQAQVVATAQPGQKRASDAIDNSFLQSVAAAAQAGAAAGGGPGAFIAIHKSASQSPNSKRVKGEQEAKENGAQPA